MNLIELYRKTGERDYLKQYYERPSYRDLHARSDAKWERKFRLLGELMAVSPGQRILDVGCATQRLRPIVEGAGATYFGLDISASFNPDMVGDAERLRMFLPDSFDWIVFSDVLEHLPNPQTALAAAANITRRLIAVVPNWYHLERFAFLPRHPNDRHLTRLPPTGWIQLFELSAFQIDGIRGFFYVPSVSFYPFLPLVALDKLFRTRPFLAFGDWLERRWAEHPTFRFAGQELILIARRAQR